MIDYDDSWSMEDIIKRRDDLLKEIVGWEVKINELHNVRLEIFKKVAEAERVLKGLCEHEWIRENYQYSPLYCKLCGVKR